MISSARALGTGLLLATLASETAAAQSIGVRAGASVDPDQFYIGAHFETDALIDRLYFRPNLEVGFGDDVTLTTLNFEAIYKFPLTRTPWTVYGGAGPAINVFHFENRTESEAGFNFVGGLAHERGVFVEIKVGAFDSPDLKFGVGYKLR